MVITKLLKGPLTIISMVEARCRKSDRDILGVFFVAKAHAT